MGALRVVVGGQYGSESKGSVAAWLARRSRSQGHQQVAVRVAGPNAGHTVYDDGGRKFAFRQLPVAAVVDPAAILVIAAGSEIDPPVLLDEVRRCEAAGHRIYDRLYIDPQATVIDDDHKQTETASHEIHRPPTPTDSGLAYAPSLVEQIGSTGKGIGAARADRALRRALLWGEWKRDPGDGLGELADTADLLSGALYHGGDVVIEGTQGYGLGLHAGHYPQCTSSDCRAIDFLAMAGVAPWQRGVDQFEIWVVVRAYPIRVAGNSGPLKGETTWEALGLQPELTTVTQKVRRVGQWDDDLFVKAVEANGGGSEFTRVAYAMADQRWPGLRGTTKMLEQELAGGGEMAEMLAEMTRLEGLTGAPVIYIGTGPQTQIIRGGAR